MLHLLGCKQIVGSSPDELEKSYGVHFEMEDELVSHITERSIDLLKEKYRASQCFLSIYAFVLHLPFFACIDMSC
jgi:hypothetical protein